MMGGCPPTPRPPDYSFLKVEPEDCPVCLDPITASTACTLPCSHLFHATCVADLRAFGVKQACPMCRADLPPGPEQLFEAATRRYVFLERQVARRKRAAELAALRADSGGGRRPSRIEGAKSSGAGAAGAIGSGVEVVKGRGAGATDGGGGGVKSGGAKSGGGGGGDVNNSGGTADSVADPRTALLPSPRGPTRGVRGHWDALSAEEADEAASVIAELRLAAEQGHAGSQFTLGYFYEQGTAGVAASAEEARRLYRQAAEQGLAQAQYNMGLMEHNDRAERARWCRLAAGQGLAAAQFTYGVACDKGDGVGASEVEAVWWWRKAAFQGYPQACLNLGIAHCKGKGVRQDRAEGAKWIRKAANRGLAEAQYDLGVLFEQGKVPPPAPASRPASAKPLDPNYAPGFAPKPKTQLSAPNFDRAVEMYRSAAAQGHVKAAFRLAECLRRGDPSNRARGVDMAAAGKWYAVAAEAGHAPAALQLGHVLAAPHLVYRAKENTAAPVVEQVPADTVAAAKMWRRAAEAGLPAAQFEIGALYRVRTGPAATALEDEVDENGDPTYASSGGLVPDDRRAAKWLRKAAEAGEPRAQLALGELFEAGRGVAASLPTALRLYRRAAGAGLEAAQARLARATLLAPLSTWEPQEAREARGEARGEARHSEGNAKARHSQRCDVWWSPGTTKEDACRLLLEEAARLGHRQAKADVACLAATGAVGPVLGLSAAAQLAWDREQAARAAKKARELEEALRYKKPPHAGPTWAKTMQLEYPVFEDVREASGITGIVKTAAPVSMVAHVRAMDLYHDLACNLGAGTSRTPGGPPPREPGEKKKGQGQKKKK